MAVASKKIPGPDRVKIRTALLSVSDKSGIVELAQALSSTASAMGVSLRCVTGNLLCILSLLNLEGAALFLGARGGGGVSDLLGDGQALGGELGDCRGGAVPLPAGQQQGQREGGGKGAGDHG